MRCGASGFHEGIARRSWISAAATLVADILFGTLPAWRSAHADPMPAIHGSTAGYWCHDSQLVLFGKPCHRIGGKDFVVG
jgi:hypothetical protein